jgi:hypothetical protein
VINYRIISDDGPVLASTVTYLLPVVAVILGALVLAEPITLQLADGVAIVVAESPSPEARPQIGQPSQPGQTPALPNLALRSSRPLLDTEGCQIR